MCNFSKKWMDLNNGWALNDGFRFFFKIIKFTKKVKHDFFLICPLISTIWQNVVKNSTVNCELLLLNLNNIVFKDAITFPSFSKFNNLSKKSNPIVLLSATIEIHPFWKKLHVSVKKIEKLNWHIWNPCNIYFQNARNVIIITKSFNIFIYLTGISIPSFQVKLLIENHLLIEIEFNIKISIGATQAASIHW